MQVILNKKEKELVVKLHQENKSIQIAEIVHMSFKDIGAIIRLIDGRANEEIMSNDMRGKSKETQAMNYYELL